jgi:hypothetical protein
MEDVAIASVTKILELKPNSFFVEVSGHNLESVQTLDFRTQCLHYIPVSNHFFLGGGGGVKSISRDDDCEYQGGKLLRLLSQLRPRTWPLDVCVYRTTFALRLIGVFSADAVLLKSQLSTAGERQFFLSFTSLPK